MITRKLANWKYIGLHIQVSIRRLETYLNNEELDHQVIQAAHGNTALEVKNGAFTWDGAGSADVIKDINIHVKKGSFTCVVGQVVHPVDKKSQRSNCFLFQRVHAF